jgi:transcriptional regulator with XRE-family HTH domain
MDNISKGGDTAMSSAREQLGQEIKAVREALGLSQRAVAKMAHLSVSYVNQIELGTLAIPPLEAPIMAIGQALDATEEQIDRWVALTGKIRVTRIMSVLNSEENLRKLARATGLPASQILKLATTTVGRANEWPE